MSHGPAVWVSLAISMAAHFGIGAARSLFTGRGIWVSGRDMFVVGFGVAAVGYLIGEWLPRYLVAQVRVCVELARYCFCSQRLRVR